MENFIESLSITEVSSADVELKSLRIGNGNSNDQCDCECPDGCDGTDGDA